MAAEHRYLEQQVVPPSAPTAPYGSTPAAATLSGEDSAHGEQKMQVLHTQSRDLQHDLSEHWRQLQKFRNEPTYAGMNSLMGGLSAALKQMDHVAQMYERVLALHKLQVSQMHAAGKTWCEKFPKSQQEPSDDPEYLRMHDEVIALCERVSEFVQSFDQALAGSCSSVQPMVRESVRMIGRAAVYRPVPAPCDRMSTVGRVRLRRIDLQVSHHPTHRQIEG